MIKYYWPSAFCIDDDNIWFIYGKICVLCKYEISTEKVEIIGQVPVNDLMQPCLFQKLILADNKLFMIPSFASDIVVYDLKNAKFQIIKLKQEEGIKFNGAYINKNCIVCIPSYYDSMIGIDIHSMSVNYEYNMKLIKKQDNIEYFNVSDMFDDKKIVLCSPQSDKIYIYDMEKNLLERECVCTEKDGSQFEFVICIDNKIILCDENKREIVIYNYETKQIEDTFWPAGKKEIAVCRLDDKIVVDDFETSWVGIYDKRFKLLSESKNRIVNDRKFYFYYLTGICESSFEQNIYFNNCDLSFNWVKNGLFEKKVKLLISETHRKCLKDYLQGYNHVLMEKDDFYTYTLTDFLEDIL